MISKPKPNCCACQPGQISLELILLIAALSAFLLALLPAINEARELAQFGAVSKQEEIFLNKIAGDAREVRVLGEGNSVETKFFLPADETVVSFDGAKQAIQVSFRAGSHANALSEETGFPLRLARFNASKGTYAAEVRNDGGASGVVISIKPLPLSQEAK